MLESDSKNKICPLLSGPQDNVYCRAKDCMLWNEYVDTVNGIPQGDCIKNEESYYLKKILEKTAEIKHLKLEMKKGKEKSWVNKEVKNGKTAGIAISSSKEVELISFFIGKEKATIVVETKDSKERIEIGVCSDALLPISLSIQEKLEFKWEK